MRRLGERKRMRADSNWNAYDIAGIAMTTMIAACFSGLSASMCSWIFSDEKLPVAELIANGVLAGRCKSRFSVGNVGVVRLRFCFSLWSGFMRLSWSVRSLI